MMKQGLVQWSTTNSTSRCHHSHSISFLSLLAFPRSKRPLPPCLITITASLDSPSQQQLTAKERRQLRQEKRESKAGYSWREEVEERLIKPRKKKKVTRSEERNLDNLAKLGPKWWILRVSRLTGHDTAELLARSLARNYPQMEFKVYAPTIEVKRKLKDGTYSIKPKLLFPGFVWVWCILNKEIHDFIREVIGVGGFLGSKVGSSRRQINKPTPVSDDDMEETFQKAKQEQENYEKASQEEQKALGKKPTKSAVPSTPEKQSEKSTDLLPNGSSKKSAKKLPKVGSTVCIVSGSFAEFEGILKKVNRKAGMVTVAFSIFGKESIVDLDINDIAAETK